MDPQSSTQGPMDPPAPTQGPTDPPPPTQGPMDPRPCVDWKDLMAWEPPSVESAKRKLRVNNEGDRTNLPPLPVGVPPIAKLIPGVQKKELTPQLLVAHDYKGDYPICDREAGCAVKDCPPFLYTHWWHMDIFCFFGHKVAMVPPPSYTSIAHRHGVRSIGTICWEGKPGTDGHADFRKFITSGRQGISKAVDQFVAIMKTWQFDGWLVNMEVNLEKTPSDVEMLMFFITKLKAATIAADPDAILLWYDGTTRDGKLGWQDELNDENRQFYNVLDGIFLNYAWNAKKLVNSKPNRGAGTVLAGIDVYARSVESGGPPGKWSTHETMKKVHLKNISIALFAPGWVMEAPENAGKCAMRQSDKFWTMIAEQLDTRALSLFPVATTFCNGFSPDGKRFRVGDMDLMPHLALSKGTLVPSEKGLHIKTPGTHVLWLVKGWSTCADLRVKIRYDGEENATLVIKLDGRSMHAMTIDDDRTVEMRAATKESRRINAVYVETTIKDTYLQYFEAYNVGTDRCLE